MNIELSLSTENNKIECGSFFPYCLRLCWLSKKLGMISINRVSHRMEIFRFKSMVLVYVYKNIISLDYGNHE